MSKKLKKIVSLLLVLVVSFNATGVVYAIKNGPTHVSVRPVGSNVQTWINVGLSSIWTSAVKSVVIKLDGGN